MKNSDKNCCKLIAQLEKFSKLMDVSGKSSEKKIEKNIEKIKLN